MVLNCSGMGRRGGQGRGSSKRGVQEESRGKGRKGGVRAGSGPVGNCVCPSCGTKVPHKRGVPCYSLRCPNCGTQMVKEYMVFVIEAMRNSRFVQKCEI